MPSETIHACQCGPCSRGEAHPERERHYQTNLFLSRLDEDQRHWYLALESQRMGWGADPLLMEISGVDEKTISARTRGVGCFAGEPTCRPGPPARCWSTTCRKSLFGGVPHH